MYDNDDDDTTMEMGMGTTIDAITTTTDGMDDGYR
jgi:hypothetical protein